MKRILLFCLLFFFATTLLCVAQENQDVVYLKNGTIVRGTIIEFVPDEYVDISMQNGRVRSFSMKDVERIVNERSRPESRTARPAQNSARSQQNDYRPPQYNERYAPYSNDRYIQNDNRNSQKRKIFHVTPKIGLNKSFKKIAHIKKYQMGFDVGCALEFAFTPVYTLESGLLYTRRGYTEIYQFYGQKVQEKKLSRNSFHIPLLSKFFIHRGFNMFAGPQFGIGSWQEVSKYSNQEEDWVETHYQPSVLLSAGLGYLFYNRFSVSVIFNMDIYDKGISILGFGYYEKTVQAHIGWRF